MNKDKTELICYPVGRTGAYEIPVGVTTIKSKAFDGCTELTSLMFPSSITNIEEYAFSYSSKLTSLYFFGDGPDINWAAFDNVDVTAYYPAENSTWEKTIGTIYSFGKVKWVPWAPEKDAQAAPVVRGLHTGKADGSTVSFSGLTSGEQYVLIMAKDKNGDLLAPENLLYIAQGAADADGALTFATAPRESAENAFVALYGPGESVQPGYQPCDGSNCPGRVFSDMPVRGNWAHDPIDWAIGGGVTNGTSATTFSPEEGCTRAQVVTFLWRAAGQPEPTSSANPFADVKAGQYYYKAVLWAVEHGITNGMSATEFGPDNTCTRAQIVTFLWRYEGNPAPSSTRNPFADVSTGLVLRQRRSVGRGARHHERYECDGILPGEYLHARTGRDIPVSRRRQPVKTHSRCGRLAAAAAFCLRSGAGLAFSFPVRYTLAHEDEYGRFAYECGDL